MRPAAPQAPFPQGPIRYAERMNERDVNFFRPLWIRLLVTAIVAAWFVLEAVFSHDQLWMGITAVGVVYCVWNFFLRFPRETARAPTAAAQAPPDEPPKQP